MRACLSILLIGLLTGQVAEGGPRERITAANATLCDSGNQVCLRGTLSYYSNPRLVELSGRIQRATGPGLLVFRLSGENVAGDTRYTFLEVGTRGNYSEIVDHKLVTDHPDVEHWRLDSIRFEPGPPADSDNR